MIFVGLMLLSALVLCAAILMGRRNNAVWKERGSWITEFPIPDAGDPDFYRKMNLATSYRPLIIAVSYDEMWLKFWIPVGDWKAIARRRVWGARARVREEAPVESL